QFTATRVYGAADLVTAGGGAASQTSIYGPADLALDKAGDLWVVDQGHNRVLEFPAGCIGSPCMASRVIGQASWTADAAGTSPTATSLDEPSGLAFDGGGGLYVMDTSANRVLFFDTATCGTFDCAASRVYGQSSFTTNTAGTTATTLSSPGASTSLPPAPALRAAPPESMATTAAIPAVSATTTVRASPAAPARSTWGDPLRSRLTSAVTCMSSTLPTRGCSCTARGEVRRV
ncbi:MAG: hypothetical protein E6J20_20980, partial [Chloroflexi bacterium]